MNRNVLTKSQEELVEKLESFLYGPDKYFLLTGQPGVGKTFVLRYVLKGLLEEERNTKKKNVLGVCLAHQAKKQLKNSIPNSQTFAKAYGLKEKYDESTGERSFVFDKNSKSIDGKNPYSVIVHDEVSQYTTKMLDIVQENTSFITKVIFVGDRAQLPPIDRMSMKPNSDSPVFTWDWSEENSHELTEIVRQEAHNPLLQFAKVMRQEIFTNHNITRIKYMLSQPNVVKGLGYENIERSSVNELMKALEGTETLIIAHRNKNVNNFNRTVRNYLRSGVTRFLEPKDVIYMKDSFYKLDETGFPLYVIDNSEFLTIKDVREYVHKFKIAGRYIEIDALACSIEGSDRTVYVPTRKGRLHYEKYFDELAGLCKIGKLLWNVWWEKKKEFCSVNYAYAITSYKCQGSTLDNVIIDINDIVSCRPLTDKQKIQSIYTAMTRARYMAYFIK